MIRKLKPYLEGYHFKVVSEHVTLKGLNSIRIARWALEIQLNDFESVQKGSAKRGGLHPVKTTTTRDTTRCKGDNGANAFRRLQLDQGHVRKDKYRAAEVPELCDGRRDHL